MRKSEHPKLITKKEEGLVRSVFIRQNTTNALPPNEMLKQTSIALLRFFLNAPLPSNV